MRILVVEVDMSIGNAIFGKAAFQDDFRTYGRGRFYP